ncbi:MAG: fused MFS/spermidine synthase, partial [Planctomycetes bacterium]|nr:fused MFS/spermidine synthase [Planctomycetota bacterium]
GALPVASAVVTQRLRSLGRSVGTLYAANALGAIAGAFFPIFVLIPTVGTQWAVLITAGLNLTVGLVLLVSAPRARKRERVALAVGSLALAVLVLSLVPANSFRSIFERAVPSADRQLLYYRDGVTGTVTIHQSPTTDRILCINGLTEVPTDHASMKTFRVMGHVPMLLHPDPQRTLSITFGGGIVAGAMAQHEPEVLDVVDVCEGVFPAARLFAEENHHVLDYPGLRIFVNDARNFIAHAPDTYDVIISDCTHPKSGDSWVLFTHEFYEDVHSRLSPDGVFAQFILIHRLTYPEFGALLGTLRSTFPHSTVWVAGPYVLVVATVQPFAIDYDRVRQGLQQPQVKASLAPFGMDDPAALLANLCLDGRGVESLTQGAPINTEDRPFVGLSHLWVGDTVPVTLQHIFSHLTPASTVLQHLPTEPEQARSVLSRIERVSLSHHHATWAEYAYGQRRFAQAIDHARTALQINPEDPDARYVLASAQADLENLARLARAQVQSFPNQASGYATLARVLAARGEPARAVDSLEKALALGLDTLSVREQLGNLYLGLGQAVGAARHFREALGHRPKSAALRVSLARALLAQGRREEAEQLLKDALGREPDNVAGHETLGTLLLIRGEVEQAQEEFEAMLRSDPLLASPYIHLAHCYELRRLTPQALSNYRAALENDPYMLAAYLGLVRVLSQQGEWAAVGDWALRGLQFLPTSGELLLVLGDSALATGQLAGAEQAYRRALDINPALTSAYAGLAQVASARGDRAQARSYWQEVLRRDPQNRYARERLQELEGAPDDGRGRPLPPG